MGRFILLFIAVVLAVLFVNWLLKEDPKKVARYLRRGGLWFAVILIILLAATGRLNWVFAAIAATVPFLGRLLSALRYVPLLGQLFTHYQNAQASSQRHGAAAASGRTSRVQSRFLLMTLDHDTGNMEGEILSGQYEGKKLSDLDLGQLKELLDRYRRLDEESSALLEAYLDRVHGDQWREPGAERGSGAVSSGPMSEQEAREVLGVPENASEEEVTNAHRRLMQKLHPDRGGSTYLAAKINQAKDTLLKNAG